MDKKIYNRLYAVQQKEWFEKMESKINLLVFGTIEQKKLTWRKIMMPMTVEGHMLSFEPTSQLYFLAIIFFFAPKMKKKGQNEGKN